MSFTLQSWKEDLEKHLEGWRGRMRTSGVKSIYAFVSATALLPVIQAVAGGDLTPVMELGRLISGLGTNLLATKLQGWKNNTETEIAAQIKNEVENDQDIRAEFDELLERLDALPLAREAVNKDDRQWFKETIQKELAQLESVLKIENLVIRAENVIIEDQGATNSLALRNAYLSRMFTTCRQLSLSGVDPKTVTSKNESQLKLDAVYTALLTLTPEGQENLHKEQTPDRATRRQSTLEQLNQHSRLALLGDPGSGKSTFVNFVALCFCGGPLNEKRTNLDLLKSPLPGEGEEEKKQQPWDHGLLIPVRIILRDFAASGLPPVGEIATSEHIWRFIKSGLFDKKFGTYLKKELIEKGGLILLDGLDEVPDAKKQRTQIKQAVEDFAATYRHCRILVTSRTYAYQKQDWRLSGFSETILAPFSKNQINHFIDHWYEHTSEIRGTNRGNAKEKAEQLKRTISGNDRLYALAEQPLLLTLMASLNAWRGGSLPEKREELYADTVNLLLNWWVSPKTVRKTQSTIEVLQPSIAECLKVDMDKVRRLLNELAFKAHESQPEVVGTADIPEVDLVSGLMGLSNNPEINPAMLIEFLVDRTGLLLPRGNRVYTFPHRTFQEYLAACYLTDEEFPEKVATLVREEPNRWREVALLACAKAVRGTASILWPFVEELCNGNPEDIGKSSKDIWGAQIAAQAMVESADLGKVSVVNQKKIARVRDCLQKVLSVREFPPTERTTAGVNLAHLGDERQGILTVEEMPFCLVSKGDFWMGEDDNLHQNNTLSENFWISKYPITQSQFKGFVADGGYKKEDYWDEARDAGVWQGGKIKGSWDDRWREGSFQFRIPFSLSNHPVVGVTWYESLAFSRWLNDVWEKQGILPDGLTVKLPTEAEWEKAIRGGLEIPVQPITGSVKDLNRNNLTTLDTNSVPKRIYPWDDKPDTNCANYSDTGIGATSAVGCFPAGASPYGCEEMSGNVWEWTRSNWGKDWSKPDFKYPYKTDDGRENLNASKEVSRVLRGGCFPDDHTDMRCAYRSRRNPGYGGSNIGFRLVFSPFNSDL